MINSVSRSRSGLLSIASGIAVLLLIISTPSCKKDKEADNPCAAVTPVGSLVQNAGQFTFTTNGGGKFTFSVNNDIKITHNDYPALKIEFWGGNSNSGTQVFTAEHENLGGKHIKDALEVNRTINFPDGAKMTIVRKNVAGAIDHISIYDGAQSHRINFACGVLVHSSMDASTATQLDNAEADGEAGGFQITSTGAIFFNEYEEITPGTQFPDYYLLGEIFRNNPTQVTDHYDDPRLNHT